MSLARDRLLLVAGAASVAVGALVLFAPGLVPGLGLLEPLADADTATQVGLLLGLLVAVLAAVQMRRTARDSLDRSDLLDSRPERAQGETVPAPSAPLAATYERLRGRIEQVGRAGWHVAAYGRRARHTTDVANDDQQPEGPPQHPPGGPRQRRPERTRGGSRERRRQFRGRRPEGPRQRQAEGVDANPGRQDARPVRGYRGPERLRRQTRAELLALLDEVAVTARDTYATATGCDEEQAERAVETGEWTDSRVAAAFLATELDAPAFTVTERALAWLTPRRTLDRRLGQTLDAVEAHAEGYLTYRTARVDADNNDTDGSERGGATVGSAREDGQ